MNSPTPTLTSPEVRAHGQLGVVGPYRLALEIASGGMAVVYLAVQELQRFNNTVAVKCIHPHLAKDPSFIDMFVDEARIAASINHPYVCRVFDFGVSGDSYYIAMEFLRGEPVSKVFSALTTEHLQSPRHFAIASRVIANLAEGLHAAHTLKDTHGTALEVVHRDISPQNLFVLCDGTSRITDFGIARARVRRHETNGTVLKGKLAYIAPEQLKHRQTDRRADIWALGVVAWEFLTGRLLFDAPSEGETIAAVLNAPIVAPSQIQSTVPAPLDAIVLKALARDPAERYDNARALARDLEVFLAGAAIHMDVADWLEELMPGVGQRQDALIERAHASVAGSRDP